MMGYEFSALLSGSVLVEIVFNYPGLGQLMYQAGFSIAATGRVGSATRS